jgi:hypothetical protein
LCSCFGQIVAKKLQSGNGPVEAGALGLQIGEKLGIAQGAPHRLNREAVLATPSACPKFISILFRFQNKA